MSEWIDACAIEDIELNDLIAWEYKEHKIALYKTRKGFYATALLCTHEEESLEDGLVIDCVIECPLHGGRFDICTGKALSAPVHLDLETYPVKIESGRVLVKIPST